MPHIEIRAVCFAAAISSFAVFLPSASLAQSKGEAKFRFSEDASISLGTDALMQSVPKVSSLKNDAWLNAPVTRLDLVVFQLQQSIDKFSTHQETFLKDELQPEAGVSSGGATLEGGVGYSADTGRLHLHQTMRGIGAPKRPLKTMCEEVLRALETQYPLQAMGYRWENDGLGTLRTSDSDYSATTAKLIKSAVLSARVTATYNTPEGLTSFTVSCIKDGNGNAVRFAKSANRL